MTEHLIAPHGGELTQLIVEPERAAELQEASRDWPSWDLTSRQMCDVELLMNGGFSPLRGFMTSAEYGSVCESMRLADGTLWPIPITLDVDEAFAEGLESAICAPIAPYAAIRRENKKLISSLGGYILVHISTPLEVCEQRDRKGLYAKARAGIIKEFTGISDPYEAPKDPAVRIDTTEISPEEAAQQIFLHLEKEGYIGAVGP